MLRTRIIAGMVLVGAVLVGLFVYYSQVNPNGAFGKFPFKYGLDLSGGTHLVYKADVSKVSAGDVAISMDALRDVIERRVNLFGVGEPIVQVEHGGSLSSEGATEKLIVELPGVTDVKEAVKMIGQTPSLAFKVLTQKDFDEVNKMEASSTVKGLEFEKRFKDTGISGSMIERAVLSFDGTSNIPAVSLTFTSEGRDLFAKTTKDNVDNYIGIFLDGIVISLPVVRQPILDGKAQISGSLSVDEAKKLVRDLNYGALPVPIELISTQTVGASLGQAALQGGVRAGVVAFIVIAIFLLFWYRLPGLVAVFALGVYAVLMLAFFKLFSITLTAAGIAGFILSIGMAVDANILIFERMREELRSGKGMSDAMHEGFARAWLSIRDSNLSSIITGLILFYFGSTSIIKGFALVFLGGVLISMFSAITASRLFLYAIAPKNAGKVSKFLFSNGFSFIRSKSSHN